MKTDEWKTVNLWRKRHDKFIVEVSRHDSCDGDAWCVYAYIYQSHPCFMRIDKSKWCDQDVIYQMPLHFGGSYFSVNYSDDGKEIKSYKIGADYKHLGDDRFSSIATKDMAYDVFADAEELYTWLEEKTFVRKDMDDNA